MYLSVPPVPLVAPATPASPSDMWLPLLSNWGHRQGKTEATAMPVRQSERVAFSGKRNASKSKWPTQTHTHPIHTSHTHILSMPLFRLVSGHLCLYANPSLFRLMGFINKSFRGFPI